MRYNNKALKKLLTFDKIRISKLLEISQYSILSIIPSIIIGKWLNTFFTDYSNKVIKNKYSLILSVLINVIVYVVATFYIEKIVRIFPFYFSLDKNYKPCLKDECKIGITTSILLFFITTQTALLHNVNKLLSIELFN